MLLNGWSINLSKPTRSLVDEGLAAKFIPAGSPSACKCCLMDPKQKPKKHKAIAFLNILDSGISMNILDFDGSSHDYPENVSKLCIKVQCRRLDFHMSGGDPVQNLLQLVVEDYTHMLSTIFYIHYILSLSINI